MNGDKHKDNNNRYIMLESILYLTNQIMCGLDIQLGFIAESVLMVDEGSGSWLQLASSRGLFQLRTKGGERERVTGSVLMRVHPYFG